MLVALQNAVLCAECDVVSDSPHDACLGCGSRSLINIARICGGELPQRVRYLDCSGIGIDCQARGCPCFSKGSQNPTKGDHRFMAVSSPSVTRTMKLTVQCYLGRQADERPIRFCLGRRQYEVEAVCDQWYEAEHLFHEIRADDGNLYILRQPTTPVPKPVAPRLVSSEKRGTLITLTPLISRHSRVILFRTHLFDRYFCTLLSLTRQVIDPGIDHFAKRLEKLDARVMQMLFHRG